MDLVWQKSNDTMFTIFAQILSNFSMPLRSLFKKPCNTAGACRLLRQPTYSSLNSVFLKNSSKLVSLPLAWAFAHSTCSFMFSP